MWKLINIIRRRKTREYSNNKQLVEFQEVFVWNVGIEVRNFFVIIFLKVLLIILLFKDKKK